MALRTSNPVLNGKIYENFSAMTGDRANTMTVEGTINKIYALFALVMLGALWTWHLFASNPPAVLPYLLVGCIGGLIFALITTFVKHIAPFTAPIYAVLEGFVLGGISAMAEHSYPGIAIQAVGMTFGTLFCLLLAYKSGLIKPTDKFKLGVVAATGAIFVVYLVGFVLSFFGITMSFLYGNGIWSIVVSLIIVVVAALNLILDFDFIEQGAKQGAPAYMEWYGAFGLMVTLIWLYLEILRLLMKLRSRN